MPIICVKHAVGKALDQFMQHKTIHIGFELQVSDSTFLTHRNGQLLIKKTQGPAWSSVKKDFILLSEK